MSLSIRKHKSLRCADNGDTEAVRLQAWADMLWAKIAQYGLVPTYKGRTLYLGCYEIVGDFEAEIAECVRSCQFYCRQPRYCLPQILGSTRGPTV